MNYQNLLATIDANVYENGAQLITGDIMQQVLHALVDSLGAGYQYMGEATPAGTPAYLDPRQFWLAVTAGTYTNFGGITVDGKSLVVITYDGTFTKTVLPIPTSDALTEALADYQPLLTFDDEPTEGSANPVKSDGIARALADKVDKSEEALLPGVIAGSADKVLNPVAAFAKYLFRKTGGDANVASGPAVLRSLRGTTLIWNQLVNNGDFSNGTTGWSGSTLTIESDGSCSAVVSASGDATIQRAITLVAGHKYYFRYIAKASASVAAYGNNLPAAITLNTSYQVFDTVYTAASASSYVNLYTYHNTDAAGEKIYLKIAMVVDLSLMGLDTLTVAQFKALYPLPYYAYNPGTRINNKTVALESVGLNQWDEEVIAYGPTSIQSANYIPVFPSTAYYFCIPEGLKYDVLFYDADKVQIGSTDTGNLAGIKTTPANCAFIKFRINLTTPYGGNTYNHDICINLSDASRNGEYEPYEKHTAHLGLDEFDVKDAGGNITTVYGLDGVGTAFDEVDPVNKKYHHRMGEVDLGDLEWTYTSGLFRTSALIGTIFEPANGTVPNARSEKYVAVKYADVENIDKSFTVIFPASSLHGQIWVKDDAYSDAATFKAAMAGVKLVYDLATPEVFDLVDPMPDVYQAEAGGTEQAVQPDGGSTPNAPFYVGTQYSVEPAGSDLVVALAQGLQDAGIISAFALTYDADGKPQFTITA